ncbi:MAG TPA: efflux RND transporter permease subunit, partial [Gemmatimonadales bacterium]|nr:efflux RND transporter permease subunit [Gemmatimonadales bacterium]
TQTVEHVVTMGLLLVGSLLLVFLGDVRITLITALTIPAAILFAFALLVLTGYSANLISIGAIDFGILAEAAVVVMESVFRQLRTRNLEEPPAMVIGQATAEAAKPVLFATLIILVAFIPLFTMRGVPGRIFAPMSVTYGFALLGALLFALAFAPVLTSWAGTAAGPEEEAVTPVVRRLKTWYERLLPAVMARRRLALGVTGAWLVAALALTSVVGGEFMPKLEEGNLWIRATLPVDISFEASSALAHDIRETLRGFPAVTHVVSQMGRPDDGTDVTTFNNIEFDVQLAVPSRWPSGLTKTRLVEAMASRLTRYPGVDFGFSQNIEDNVEEAMSGVKGENSLKLFGPDIDALARLAVQIRDTMAQTPGVQDVGVFQETGQPELMVVVDREGSARYGLAGADVNAAVQAAVGGQAVTQILLGDRRFDFVVRYAPPFRGTPEAIRQILLPTPEGGHVPLGQVARVELKQGAFMIYRENGQRYIPIKFSVRGRDLASTMKEVEGRLAKSLVLPAGYHYEWAGEIDSLRKEEHRLALVIPVTLLLILGLLYALFNSWRDALTVLGILPVAATGGVLALWVTGSAFSVSAAVGFTSALGVGTLGGCVFLAGIRRETAGVGGDGLAAVVQRGALREMRPILMACLAAGLGLLPAAVSTGIGAQAQQPLARVVVGSMVTTMLAILFLIPIFAGMTPAET